MMRTQETELVDGSKSSSRHHVLVVGGGRFGLATAEGLASQFDEVSFVGEVDRVDDEGTTVRIVSRLPASVGDVRAMRDDLGEIDVVFALGRDHQSLWSAHIFQRELVPDVTGATLEDPRLESTFTATGVEPILLSELLADHLSNLTASRASVTE